MTRVWGLAASIAALSLAGPQVRAQVMEEEQAAPTASATAVARSAPPTSPGPAPALSSDEIAGRIMGGAPPQVLSFTKPWPEDAPQTVKGSAMAQTVDQLRARFADPAWTPAKTMVHGPVVNMPRKTVDACGALHDFRMTTSGAPHHIREYRGAAKWCAFNPINPPAKVAGLILYTDGSYWLGEVSGTSTSFLPAPSGVGEAGYANGLRVLGVAVPNAGSDRGRGVETFGFSTSERVIFPGGAMRAASLDASGTGEGEMRWPDGRVFRGRFKDKKPGRGQMMFASGARVTGTFSSNAENLPPTFSGFLYLDLAKAEGAFPAGTYRARPTGSISDYRTVLGVNAIPTPETLTQAPALDSDCPAPSVVPQGWIPWNGGCRTGERPRTVVYAPDARSFIEEQPRAVMPLRLITLSANGEVRRIVRARALTGDAVPAPVGEGELVGPDNSVTYRGAFLGQTPNGPGMCATPAAEGGGEEPCFYAQGARTDEIHLARREAAEAERQLKLAEAAAQQEANARAEAQRRVQQAQAEADQRAYEAQQADQRRMAQMEEDEDDSSSGVNPIYAAMQELQGKYAAAAVDMQNQRAQTDAMRANIEAQYQARQAEQARQQAQRNADAARQNAALNQQNADAARRAEIARQEAARAAQARAESLRLARERQQAAMAQAQLAQRQSASSMGGGGSMAPSGPSGAAPRQNTPATILTFTNTYGWKVGDNSNAQNAQGISVSFTVASSTIADRMYYRARFCDAGSGAWEGGMRLTATYPDRTHATIRVPQGGCAAWSEHLVANAKDIYILVDKNDG